VGFFVGLNSIEMAETGLYINFSFLLRKFSLIGYRVCVGTDGDASVCMHMNACVRTICIVKKLVKRIFGTIHASVIETAMGTRYPKPDGFLLY
jgi:hypothetical protein